MPHVQATHHPALPQEGYKNERKEHKNGRLVEESAVVVLTNAGESREPPKKTCTRNKYVNTSFKF